MVTGPLTVAGRVSAGPFSLDVRLDVRPGETLGVIGPNGAGKSTLLRVVAGLTALDEGRVSLGGQVWDDPGRGVFVDPTQRHTPVVFQDYRLFPHLSVRDNVAYPHRARGLPRRQARDRAGETLDRFGLAELANRRPREISGGQAQRVAMARAMTTDPHVLLLDEPLAALDARTRQRTRLEVKAALREFPGPAMVVTHDPLEAMTLADTLLVLDEGRVVQVGTPADIAARPVSDYVAQLVGINLYAGTLTSPGTVAIAGGGTLRHATEHTTVKPGQAVLVALAPGAISIHLEQPAGLSAQNVWPGTIRGIEQLRDRIRLDLEGTPGALADITPAAFARLGLEVGARVWLSAKATEVSAYAAGQ